MILNSIEKKQITYTYLTFLMNGLLALSIGCLMPYIKESMSLSYGFVGLLVSLHSIGNFISSFFAGTIAVAIGRKRSIILFEICFFLSYLLIFLFSLKSVLVIAFLMTGLARGASSNFANTVINNIAPGHAGLLNALHAMFSVGALLFPILLTAFMRFSLKGWRYCIVLMIVIGIICLILYAKIPVKDNLNSDNSEKNSENCNTNKKSEEENISGFGFFKEPLFYLVTLTIFFYLCVEQGVIGWLVTYFTDTGLLSESLSQLTGTLMWTMMLLGRLTVAFGLKGIKKENMLVVMGIGVGVFFCLLLSFKNPLYIMLGLSGFGISMAGIYATTVSFAGRIIQKYSLCWSFILTIASFGSIIMPMIIGEVAERFGIFAGMSTIMVVVLIDIILIVALKIHIKKETV